MLSSSELDLLRARKQRVEGLQGELDDETPVESLLDDFGARFVSAFRRRSGEEPAAVRPLDLVDVYAESGQFMLRGVVEGVNDTHAVVRVSASGAGPRAVVSRRRVALQSCRHAYAPTPPGSLAEWEATGRQHSGE